MPHQWPVLYIRIALARTARPGPSHLVVCLPCSCQSYRLILGTWWPSQKPVCNCSMFSGVMVSPTRAGTKAPPALVGSSNGYGLVLTTQERLWLELVAVPYLGLCVPIMVCKDMTLSESPIVLPKRTTPLEVLTEFMPKTSPL